MHNDSQICGGCGGGMLGCAQIYLLALRAHLKGFGRECFRGVSMNVVHFGCVECCYLRRRAGTCCDFQYVNQFGFVSQFWLPDRAVSEAEVQDDLSIFSITFGISLGAFR